MPDDILAEKQLGRAYWLTTHRLFLKKILIVFLIFVIVSFAAFNLYLLIFNLSITGSAYNSFVKNIAALPVDYQNLRQSKLPQPIQTSGISAILNSNGYDILADIANPNLMWAATFNYQFDLGGTMTDKLPGFIWPGESKKIYALDVPNGNSANNLIFSDLVWTKVINFEALKADKFNIEVSQIAYLPPEQLGLTGKNPVSRVTFSATNKSAYNYRSVVFQIYLLASGQPVAVNHIKSGPILSGETKNFEVNFFQTLPKISEASIIPTINILDPSAILSQ